MQRVRLIHWDAAEARDRIERLTALGWRVEHDRLDEPQLRKALREDPPALFVVDLTRRPATGLEIGVALRRGRTTRASPLVFVGGEPEKVERVRSVLPDATFTTWERIGAALHAALRSSPATPIVPKDTIAFAGTPLWKKLGVKPGARVALIDAPAGFERALAPLPDDVALVKSLAGRVDLAVWFVTSARDLQRRVATMGARAPKGQLWIAWPKQAARVDTDVTQDLVRSVAIANGLVDYKVCSLDATWSGLKFSRKD